MSPTATIVFYIIDVILICIGITFKILTKRRMGGKKKIEKENEKDMLKNGFPIEGDLEKCRECPHFHSTFTGKKKNKVVNYCCYEGYPDCAYDIPFMPADEEVN